MSKERKREREGDYNFTVTILMFFIRILFVIMMIPVMMCSDVDWVMQALRGQVDEREGIRPASVERMWEGVLASSVYVAFSPLPFFQFFSFLLIHHFFGDGGRVPVATQMMI